MHIQVVIDRIQHLTPIHFSLVTAVSITVLVGQVEIARINDELDLFANDAHPQFSLIKVTIAS